MIGAQEPKTVMKRKLVFLDVFGWDFSSVTADMASKKIPRQLAGFRKRGQRAGGGDHLTECEERLHAVTDAKCFS